MSGIIHKVKDAISGHDKDHDTRHTGTHDTYGSSHTTSGHGAVTNPGFTTGAGSGTSGLNSGPGYNNHGSTSGSGTYGTGADISNNYGSSSTGNYGSSNINAGPHDSSLANKVDPRVDSDHDHRGTHRSGNSQFSNDGSLGNNSIHHPTGGHGYGARNPVPGNDTYGSSTHGHATSGHGYGSSNSISGNDTYDTSTPRYTAGGHGYGLNNSASGNDAYGTSIHGHTTSGHGYGSNNPISSNDAYGTPTNGQSSYNQNTSKTAKTTGPHKSDLMNKLDPRVDARSNPISQQRSGY